MKKLLICLLLIFIMPLGVNALSPNYENKVYEIIGEEKSDDKVDIYFFFGSGCPHCQDEEENFIDLLDNSFKDKYVLHKYETWNSNENLELMKKVKESFGITAGSGVPFTVIGDQYWSGYTDSKGEEMMSAIQGYLETATIEDNKVEEQTTIGTNKYYCDNGNTKLEPCNEGNIRIPVVDTTKKVYDFGDYLTDDEESKLREKINTYIEKYNMDLVFVIIEKNPYGVSDHYTQVYSQDFYDYNGFGVGNTKDGTIVLIDMDNRYPFITTTGQAILMYDEQRINNVHDAAYDYLKSGNYFEAFNKYLTKLSNYAGEGIPSSNKYYCIDANGDYYKCKEAPKTVGWGIAFCVGLVGTLIIVLVHLTKYKGIKLASNANYYLKDSTITNSKDNFLTTFTSRVKIQRDSGGGSSHGGGSSISRGSSGTSHGGGGGRHF